MSNDPPNSATVIAAHHTGQVGLSLQDPFDVAVVMPTILRPEVVRAAKSVFAQENAGRIHLLIGIDKAVGDPGVLNEIRAEVPDNVLLTVMDLGYSTSQRHGGFYPAHDGGALRTVLSYIAHAPYIAYLDDDNWWAPDHLSTMLDAVRDKDWAFSLRWFVDPTTQAPLVVDTLESVGPGRGAYVRGLGGWVDPNCLIIDAKACEAAFRLWCHPMFDDPSQLSSDRRFYGALQQMPRFGETNRATCFYTMNPKDDVHDRRMAWIAKLKSG